MSSPPTLDAAGAADQIAAAQRDLQRVREELGRVIVGQDGVVRLLLVALLADGHVLLEGAPGLGKTLLVRSLAAALDMQFRRVQCTPDLMPPDVTGSVLLSESGSGPRFDFSEGPVFTNVLLVDEINRATPKTQSALLEAMEERHVTAGGATRPLPDPFLVLATQNPIEMEGTYPLPEAQLDRFLLKALVTPPNVAELVAIVQRTTTGASAALSAVLDGARLSAIRTLVRQIAAPPALLERAARLITATRPDDPAAPDAVRRYVRYGASPRGARALVLAAKSLALMDGRPHAALRDLRDVALPTLRHRLILSFEAEADGVDADDVLTTVLPSLDAA